MTNVRILMIKGAASASLLTKLEEMGYSFCEISTAAEAAGAAAGAKPDVIIADLAVPEWPDVSAAALKLGEELDAPVVYLVPPDSRQLRNSAGPLGYVLPDSGRREIEMAVEMAIYRHKAERRIRESESRAEAITSAFDEGVYVLSEQGELTFMNPEAEHLLGWTETELLGKNFHDIVHAGNERKMNVPFEDCIVCKALRTGRKQSSENEIFRRRDGTTFTVVLATTPVTRDGKIIASVTVFRDTSTRRRMEEEMLKLKKLEALSTLAGGIAHNFNNLLTAIIGNISFAKMFVPPEDRIFERMAAAEKAALQAKDLTYQLLVFARGGEAERKTVSPSVLIRNSVEFAMSGSNIRCDMEVPEDLWPIDVDTSQMRQVFLNIVTNAKEAMPGGGTIRIDAENVTIAPGGLFPLAEGRYVKITMRDHGRGIPKEDLVRIFDPYFTTKDAEDRKGAGFGLALCYSIIKSHGGLITAESEVGVGTTFSMYLPASAKEIIARKPFRERPLVGKGRVLIMDDEEIIRLVTGNMLGHMGYKVAFARTGEEAIEEYKRGMAKGEPFDVVILDLTIRGGMGGGEAIQQLKAIDPGVRAIVSSGYTRDPVMVDHAKFGFSGVLPKPYKIQELFEALQSAQKQEEKPTPQTERPKT